MFRNMFISVSNVSKVILMPGTPMIVGGGFVFSKVFGFTWGIILVSGAALISSTVGYSAAFCFGRYFLQDEVKQRMLQKYPMFEAIDEGKSI